MNHERSKSSFHRFNSAVDLGAHFNGALVMIQGAAFFVAFMGALFLASPHIAHSDSCRVNPKPEFCGVIQK